MKRDGDMIVHHRRGAVETEFCLAMDKVSYHAITGAVDYVLRDLDVLFRDMIAKGEQPDPEVLVIARELEKVAASMETPTIIKKPGESDSRVVPSAKDFKRKPYLRASVTP
jgi:hypothetical protein